MTEGVKRMYSKHHLLTDIYKVKQDLRHIYTHGSCYMVSTSISAIKSMIFQLEDIEKLIRIRNGNSDAINGKSGNGFNGDGSAEPLYPEVD